ncbi:hypothetical protein QOZ84_07925 [Romboutsia sedimentorum]|uniref:Uncharacterized protein n=1 Tax=Romboutsia sedimentorum TaxID=1368474 RepID=A0ABT7E958_9FIRM|nr:hypothetical protein [Romboutsia sedimentorum]MDK2563475.1 hypothetical protein [Romboutsia sedimentorum]MDK2585200.1 hypothetical protein [Romboutsia sedimentorum]
MEINTKEEFDILNKFLNKKRLTYNEFNSLIGNYFVKDYEELEDNYYLVEVLVNSIPGKKYYTDYIEIINQNKN